MLRIYETGWYLKLVDEFQKPYFKELEAKIDADKKAGKLVLPLEDRIFKAYELCPFDRVKVVIIGQDPYLSLKQATGLAFSVPETEKLPPSLRNMLRELKNDYGISKTSGDLTFWALQGVLLLNTVLTTETGRPNSHAGYGWEKFTDQTIKVLARQGKPVIYWLLGNCAQKKEEIINMNSSGPTLIIKTPHPSPQSAYKGWFWSKPYSKTNVFLVNNNVKPINWEE